MLFKKRKRKQTGEMLDAWLSGSAWWCVVVRGAWCVVRGAWCVVRGAWCVVRGAWCVVVRVYCVAHLEVKKRKRLAAKHWYANHLND
jgi:hypothetical protein